MNNRYLFKAKVKGNATGYADLDWIKGNLIVEQSTSKHFICDLSHFDNDTKLRDVVVEVDPSTLCQCTGLKDKNGTLIFESDILMCNNNPKDLVKAVFGEFSVIDTDSLSVVEKVVGWHYKVIPTDEMSKCKPFCLSMPLTDFYIDMCYMKVCGSIFDNHELLEVE